MKFYTFDMRNAHPNTALIDITGKNGRKLSVQASSLGGGRIMVNRLDGKIDVNFSAEKPTLIVHNIDQPGHVAEVTSMLSHKCVNIATMQLFRGQAWRVCGYGNRDRPVDTGRSNKVA